MSQLLRSQRQSGYDANLLFDELLRRFNLENDEALAQCLGLGHGLLRRIRHGETVMGATLLMRISEHSGIAVADLRRMAGDRRTEIRLEDLVDAEPRPPVVQPAMRYGVVGAKTGLVRDDPGLPANVQWN